jgi:membrane-bound ClpP family serine protease
MNLFIYIYLTVSILGLIILLCKGEVPKFVAGAALVALVVIQFTYLPAVWALGTVFTLQFAYLFSENIEDDVKIGSGIWALVARILLLVNSSL